MMQGAVDTIQYQCAEHTDQCVEQEPVNKCQYQCAEQMDQCVEQEPVDTFHNQCAEQMDQYVEQEPVDTFNNQCVEQMDLFVELEPVDTFLGQCAELEDQCARQVPLIDDVPQVEIVDKVVEVPEGKRTHVRNTAATGVDAALDAEPKDSAKIVLEDDAGLAVELSEECAEVEEVRSVFVQLVAARFEKELGWDPLEHPVFANCLRAQLVKRREMMLRSAKDKEDRDVFARWVMECVLEEVQRLAGQETGQGDHG